MMSNMKSGGDNTSPVLKELEHTVITVIRLLQAIADKVCLQRVAGARPVC